MTEKEIKQKAILAVDDEPNSLELLGFILKRAHYRVILTSIPEEALQLIEKESPDLIILDLLMPIMNGTDLCKAIKSNPLTNHIPILFLSAMVKESEIEAGIRAGAAGFIFKPYDTADVLKNIEEILSAQVELKSK